MTNKSIFTAYGRKFNASILGACLTAGLLAAAVTPAHADIYNPYGGTIPYYYTDDNGKPAQAAAFQIESQTASRSAWFAGSGTTSIGESNSKFLALRITQLLDSPKICVQVNKLLYGWTTPQEQCTTIRGSQITLGTGIPNAIHSMTVRLKDCTYNDNLTADASIEYVGSSTLYMANEWQGAITGQTCSQKIPLGVHTGYFGVRLGAVDLKITRNDGNCATCSSASAPLPVTTPSAAPVAGGLLRPVAW
jgi:hypothetical protein